MAEEHEDQKEIFYAILAGYVKHKLGGGEIAFGLWQEAGSEIVRENWLQILSIYAVMLKCCGLSMVFTPNTVLQGDDAKHFTSFCYAKFLASNAVDASNEMYVQCAKLVSKLLTEGYTKWGEEN
jgi:hypothetical protein